MIHSYKVSCERDNLRLIREFVGVVLKSIALSEIEINQLILAVDEVCSNLIIHSQQCNPEKSIEIHIHHQPDSILFELMDYNSEHFDLSNYQKPNIHQLVKERRKGGFGLMLVNNIMDHVEVAYEKKCSTWRMYKYLKPQKS